MNSPDNDETLLNGDTSSSGPSSGSGQTPVPASSPASGAIAAGTRLGDYSLEKLLGAGAMGEVYLARQVRLDQTCALKILPEALTRSRDFEKRFEQEGRSMAKLDHPHIVRVHNASVDAGRHFIAMEYVGGGTLDDLLAKRGGMLPEKEAQRLLSEILSALSYAHAKNVIHRDLKPANILITETGHAKIGDFGLALVAGEEYVQSIIRESIVKSQLAGYGLAKSFKLADDAEATLLAGELPKNPRSTSLPGGEDETLLAGAPLPSRKPSRSSDAGAFVGTLDYMSPEIRDGTGDADARSDLFAIGIMAYNMLTGRKPRGRSKSVSVLNKKLSRRWDAWVDKCMEAEPEDRFQSADEALASFRFSGARSGRKFLIPLAIALLLVASGSVATVALMKSDAGAGDGLGSFVVGAASSSDGKGQGATPGAETTSPANATYGRSLPATMSASDESLSPSTEGEGATAHPDACPEAVPATSISFRESAASRTTESPAGLSGTLRIESSPEGAQVIDSGGKGLGVTPLVLEGLDAGSHAYTLRLDGYQEAEVSARMEAGQNVGITRNLVVQSVGALMGRDWTLPDQNIGMLWIAPGSFSMGSPASERGRQMDERAHPVRISQGFWLGKTEVTQGQWQVVMGGNPSRFQGAGPDVPVENVSWEMAMAFCLKLTESERRAGRLPEGYEYSLPTEAQWEYACRAGTNTVYSWGAAFVLNLCNAENNSRAPADKNGERFRALGLPIASTMSVAQFPPNAYGLYDMNGNVCEWCGDWYSYFSSASASDPQGPAKGSLRVVRGGSWNSAEKYCRSASRQYRLPGSMDEDLGFRLALIPIRR